jgi:hypothetical protein
MELRGNVKTMDSDPNDNPEAATAEKRILLFAVANEVNFAHLFLTVARTAYRDGAYARGEQARSIAKAAILKAHVLLDATNHDSGRALLGDLERLAKILDAL